MRFEQMTKQLEGLRAQAVQAWPKLTKSDLSEIGNDPSSLAGALARRYSIPAKKAREEAKEFFDGLSTSVRDAASAVGDAARDLWRNGRDRVVDVVHAGGEQVDDLWGLSRDKLSRIGSRAKRTMHDRPLVSLGVAAGVGALLALLLRRR